MPRVAQIEITGVSEALGNMTERLVESGSKEDPVVKISVQMDKDGFASVGDVIVWGEIKEDESFAAKLKGFFGGGKNETTDEETSETSQSSTTTSTPATSPDASAQTENGTASSTATPSPTPTLSAKERSTIRLSKSITYQGIVPMTGSEKRKSRDRYVHRSSSGALISSEQVVRSRYFRSS